MADLRIRPYLPTDRDALFELLRLNTPTYFAPEEETDLALYMREHLEDYFVAELNELVVGAGGINYFDQQTWARLSWDLVHPDYQGQGIGRELALHRLAKLRSLPFMQWVQVRASQLVYPFYQKLGFVLEKVEKDFWAPGIDLYQLNMRLAA
jgi:[ribosomal protein S18]-alanine N-acetyltransferase